MICQSLQDHNSIVQVDANFRNEYIRNLIFFSLQFDDFKRQALMINQDQLRLIGSLAALVVLSYFIRSITVVKFRYIYSLVLGLILQLYVFRHDMLGIYIQTLIVFAILKLRKGKKCGAIITFQSMIFLSIYHVRQLIYNYGGWTMNAEALLMILVCKFSLLAYAIDDGKTSEQKLSIQQKQFKITEDITFYEYLGFLNFLPTCLIGPPFEYKEYKNFMEGIAPYDKIPNTISETLKTLGHSILCAGIFVIGQLIFPISYMRTDQFFERSAFYVALYTFGSLTFIRFKYYFGWKLSISAIHACGVSYNGINFHAINTCSPFVIQTDKHIRDKISHWNTSVQQWLRKCIYQRSPFKSRGISQLYVFMVSAFWHGFYAGYYFSFFMWFVQVYVQGEIFRYVKSENSKLRVAYKKLGFSGNVILTVLVNFIFSHNATFFILLQFGLCMKLLQKVNYIPQIILFMIMIIFTVLNMSGKKQMKVQREQINKVSKKDG